MFYLGLVGFSCILFGGFLVFTMIEARTRTRLLGGMRNVIDTHAGRLFFIAGHVNWTEFLSHTIRAGSARFLHDVAHFFLLVVRFIERQLTRMVRYLRNSRPNVLAPKPSRRSIFATTGTYLRERLRRPRKNVDS